jgi:hypothetical protein
MMINNREIVIIFMQKKVKMLTVRRIREFLLMIWLSTSFGSIKIWNYNNNLNYEFRKGDIDILLCLL